MIKKSLTLLSFVSLLTVFSAKAQIGYSEQVDSIIQLVNIETLTPLMQQLSGVIPTTVNGQTVTIASRNYSQPGNNLAAQYIFEKFQSYGYTPSFQTFGSSGGQNVIAIKTGTSQPTKYYIICGHYDSMPSGATAPGADDNASGTIGVLEASRVLKDIPTDCSIIFITFDEEERGLYGSEFYSAYANTNSIDIQGVINLDMIAYDGNSDNKVSLISNTASASITDDIISSIKVYTPELIPLKTIDNTANSDHAPFWQYNYKAMLIIEDLDDFHPYYHTVNDNIASINWPFFESNARVAIATLLSLANNYKIDFAHTTVASGSSTSAREASVVISSESPISGGDNAPRLYYSTDGGTNFDFVMPNYTNQDTFKFLIPGQEIGTSVNYYFAAQDAQGRFSATYPAGGKGIDPPGSIHPSTTFSYQVAHIAQFDICSTTLPKPIPDMINVIDTIVVSGEGNIIDLNVKVNINHTWTGDLGIYLTGPDGQEITLSSAVGSSGDNYTNTIFDDEAEQGIQGSEPPFTGSFKPTGSLSTFDGQAIAGNWILRIYDTANGDTGTLLDYCLSFTHSETATPTFYNVEISKEGNGSVDPETGTHEYEEGSIATLTATPDTEWIFQHWVINEETITTNPLQITVDGNKNIVAVFQTTESITEHIINPLVVYPNPAKDLITVELPANSQGVLQIFDSKGVMVSELKNDIISSHQEIKLDVSSWADGIYIVVLLDQMKRSTSKISIQK